MVWQGENHDTQEQESDLSRLYRLWSDGHYGGQRIYRYWCLAAFFYTTFVGLSPLEAASIVAVARIVDAVVSLFMGSFTDHFYKNYLGSKFGRRRFFLLIGAPLMLVSILLWLNGMNFWLYLAFEIIAAVVLIPWETLPSEMTKDFNDRTKLSTCRMFLSASGTFMATLIPGVLIGWLGEIT